MLIKIKKAVHSKKKGHLDVTYKVNGQLRNTTIKHTKDVKSAIVSIEKPKKKAAKVPEVKK